MYGWLRPHICPVVAGQATFISGISEQLNLHSLLFQPEYIFVRMAFLVSLLASVAFGVVGTFVVVRRIGYLAGAISHCAFGGIGIGIFLRYVTNIGVDPVVVAVIIAILSAVIIGLIQRSAKEREDSVIGAIWALGMALGILALNQTREANNISSYLFGDIFLVSETDCFLVGFLSLFVAIITIPFFNHLKAVCFDEEFTLLRGIPTFLYFQGLLILIAVSVVLLVRVVGMLLVIALLTLPAATAGRFASRLLPMAVLAVGFCWLYSWLGIAISLYFNVAAGPVIILVAAFGYITAIFLRKI